MEKRNEVLELSFQFALEIIDFAELLEEQRKYIIGRQILKTGTSIGANIREAQSCESRADFIHKLKIAQKEAEETDYWLALCEQAKTYSSPPEDVKEQLLSIKKLLSKIIYNTKLKN